MAKDKDGYYNIFTFMQKQEERDMYRKIYGNDSAECRKFMVMLHGDQFAFQYEDEETAGVYRHSLTELQ